jgi:magnesium transporter
MDFTRAELLEADVASVTELKSLKEADSVTWINVVGLGSVEPIDELGQLFGVIPLVLEDILNVGQRPKFEDHGSFGFFLSYFVRAGSALDLEQLSVVFGRGFVVTFQEGPEDCFGAVRERIRSERHRIRNQGTAYLTYALVDALVDSIYPLVNDSRERLEEIEDLLFHASMKDADERLHGIRRKLRALRRVVEPTTDAIHQLLRPGLDLVSDDDRVYLADCWDHARRLLDMIDGNRSLANDLVDLHMSQLSNRLNEVMKVLTIFAAIFIPLTFIAGIYGMNFDPDASPWNMPELGWAYGYPAVIGSMVATAAALLYFFKRKGWIGSR